MPNRDRNMYKRGFTLVKATSLVAVPLRQRQLPTNMGPRQENVLRTSYDHFNLSGFSSVKS
jgi:hypothetical protein